MRLSVKPTVVVVGLALFGLPVLSARTEAPTAPAPEETVESWSGLTVVRTLELDDLGFSGPTGLAWSERLGALVATESTAGRTRATAFTGDENLVGRVRLPDGAGADGVSVDPASGAVTVLSDDALLAIPAAGLRGGKDRPSADSASVPSLPDADGATHDHTGALVVLSDGELVRVGDDGSLSSTKVDVPAGHELRGLTTHPETGELYTLDVTDQELLALDVAGHVVTAYGADDVDLYDVQDIAFGASGDPTDDPSVTRLFIADAGAPGATGAVLETTLQQQGLAASYTVPSSQIRTVATSSYNPPSPDPSGVAYLSGADRLFISDGEVNEMSIFQNVNLFQTTRAGAVQTTGVTLPWSAEPVGVGYNPGNNHLFISDDDEKQVNEIVAGGDGRFGTGDDTVTSWTVDNHGVADPEGIDYDPVTNSLWIAGGEASDYHRQTAGGDNRFGTSDDVYTHWDGGRFGIADPEGMGYDAARDTIVLLDDASQTIYEFDKTGALLNTIDISAAGGDALAGLAVGPSSSGTGRSYYAVARGVDNNSNPNENDGRLYEITNPLPGGGGGGPVNQAPIVNAGVDRSVTLPDSVTMAATVTDDNLPDPPRAVSLTWSVASGPPGTVTFSPNATVEDPTVTFQNAGTYVLRLTANDGAATSADEVTVQVAPVGGSNSTEVRVSAGSDDAEQGVSSGSVQLTSSDLELTTDGNTQQLVGVRFANLQVPKGATVLGAYVQFRTDETSTGASAITIRAETADNAPTYTTASQNVSSRQTTSTGIAWSPPDWNSVGEAGAAQRTPDLTSLVQSVVNRAGWVQGNALALQFSGTGRRTAEAFEGGAATAPLLHVDYTTGSGGGPTNAPPVVSAGTDQTITLPATASLDGTVTDDGLPNPPAQTTSTWSKVSGVGTVTFSPNATTTDVTATFSQAGTYVLRLVGSDSVLSAQDEVTVTVNPATPTNLPPTVNAGPDQEITLPATATMDAAVTDDGLPNPPGAVTRTWTRLTGPAGGTATFDDPSAEDPVVTFSIAGTYVLQLAASDGALGDTDTVTVIVNPAGGGGPTNTAPTVDAGPDQQVTLPASATMAADAMDDGLPNPPGSLSYAWTQDSGPAGATATFSSASVQDPVVSFSTAGTYVLRLTASDGQLTGTDTVTISVNPSGGGTSQTVEQRVAAGSDDAEQSTKASGNTALSSDDLEITTDGGTVQLIGIRFRNLPVPRGATITNAYLQFRVDGVSTAATNLLLRAEAADNTPTYQNLANNVSSRATTTQSVSWVPPGWDVVGAEGAAQRTPDLKTLVQAVVSRTGWASGNALAFQISGTGMRKAVSYEGGANLAPLLHVEYTGGSGGGGTTNAAPVVDAGPDQTITLPSTATMNATVTDDNLPTGSTVTRTWSQDSGPTGSTATFSSTSAEDPVVTFPTAGTYVLRLTASDGALTGTDTVTITVNPSGGTTNAAPVVDAGPDQTITLPATATMNATVTDDNLPTGSTVTRTWSQDSGPTGSTATFSSTSAEDPVVTFPTAGTYVLRLTASDGALSGTDTVTITVNPSGGGGTSQTFEKRVSAGSDDTEQSTKASGNNYLTSDDLEITTDGTTVQLIGIRFTGVTIPRGATITNAYLQFRVDGVSTAATNLLLRAEAADNTPTYTATANNVSARSTTTQSVSWVPPGWDVVGAEGAAQRTPDLKALVQAVVSRTGWASGNALAFQISGTGMRKAVAYEGGAGLAPLLHVEYTVG